MMIFDKLWWVLKEGKFILYGTNKAGKFVLGKASTKEAVMKALKDPMKTGVHIWQAKHCQQRVENALTLIK